VVYITRESGIRSTRHCSRRTTPERPH